MNPLTQSKNTTILPVLIALALICFALAPQARGVCQDDCLTNDNTVLGDDALINLTTGHSNTAVGFHALMSIENGTYNTAVGFGALESNTVHGNTAMGYKALHDNTSGSFNTAIGPHALGGNLTGSDNTATGYRALERNETGNNNTATGEFALINNTIGDDNTATGLDALEFNTTGFRNTATGVNALRNNIIGFANTAVGYGALANNTASQNTAIGGSALASNTTGSFNMAAGRTALRANTTGGDNTAVGDQALSTNTTGSSNIALGRKAGASLTIGDDNIDIGNSGVAGESKTIRMGTDNVHTATYIAGIYDSFVDDRPVYIRSDGELGTPVSSRRYKDEIKPMGKASEALFALKPVTFRYKQETDPSHRLSYGLIAEDVAGISADLISRDMEGKPQTVRYEAVNAMLLNEFLKEHRKGEQQDRKIEELEATITQFKNDFRATVTQLTARLDEQDAKIQKVSAQLEVSKPAPQMVENSQ